MAEDMQKIDPEQLTPEAIHDQVKFILATEGDTPEALQKIDELFAMGRHIRHQEEKPKRGRPNAAMAYYSKYGHYKDAQTDYNNLKNRYWNQSHVLTQRQLTNCFYEDVAVDVLKEAASEIACYDLIDPPGFNKRRKAGILEQLGRMVWQDNYAYESVIAATQVATLLYAGGATVKAIEKHIRRIRKSGTLSGEGAVPYIPVTDKDTGDALTLFIDPPPYEFDMPSIAIDHTEFMKLRNLLDEDPNTADSAAAIDQ